jgi:IS30 family transposase
MSQLSYEECLKIQIYLDDNLKARGIARKLCRSNSTISDEIKKHSIN